jgi:hypothetical protein
MHLIRTNQPNVYKHPASGTYFEDDGLHPLSVELRRLRNSGNSALTIEDPQGPGYAESRRASYVQHLPLNAVLEAVLEYLTEDRPQKLEELKAIRAQIKEQFPKT